MVKLLKISLIIALTGIFLLLVLSYFIIPEVLRVDQISSNLLNKEVAIIGKITYIKSYSDFGIIKLKDDSGEIYVTIDKNISLELNKKVKVKGIVTDYKNKLEINANKITSQIS